FGAWMSEHEGAEFLHWGWGGVDGFGGLAARAAQHHATVKPPPSEQTFDLAAWCKGTFGPAYVNHPRFPDLAALNGVKGPSWLSEDEAAAAWRDGEDVRLLRSLESKVEALRALYQLAR